MEHPIFLMKALGSLSLYIPWDPYIVSFLKVAKYLFKTWQSSKLKKKICEFKSTRHKKYIFP